MRFIFLSFLLCLLYVESKACLKWKYDVSQEPSSIKLPVFYRSLDTEFAYQKLNSRKPDDIIYTHSAIGERSFENELQELFDKVFYLTCLKRYYEALEITLKLNQKYPNNHQVLSTLGTLYEYTGNLNLAYKFIQKALELDSNPDLSYEWVHLAALKAKINLQKDPNWIYYNSVLNIELPPTQKISYQENLALRKAIQIISQYVKTTLPFTQAPDVVISKIMQELGLLLERQYSLDQAYIAFQISAHYDEHLLLTSEFHVNRLAKKLEGYETRSKHYNKPVLANYFPPQETYQSYDVIIVQQKRQREIALRKLLEEKNIMENEKNICKIPISHLKVREKLYKELIKDVKRRQVRTLTILLGLLMLIIQLISKTKNSSWFTKTRKDI